MSQPKLPLGTNLSTMVLVLQTNEIANVKKFVAPKGDPKFILGGYEKLFEQLLVGAWNSNIDSWINNAYASGTITLSSHVAADTVTVNGTVLTCSASAQDATHYKLGATDTATAANLATCINASAVNTVVYATSALTVVTIFCRVPGTIGNLGTLAISAHGSRSGANLTGGTDGTYSNQSSGL